MSAVHRTDSKISVAVKTILACAACAVAANAFAAEESASGGGLEEVVVTGYRASLEKALDQKRASVAAVDAIVAEDIAKFPDNNLAESVQRISGVTISRDAGEGREISVRGLGAQFTRVRINGMEALTTTGSTDASGGTNRDRSFDFNVFASELFNRITVRKTAAAEVEEGSLGATVDLQVAHPFDYQGLTFVTSAKGAFNDLSKDWDPRAAALISDTFADNTFGVLLSAAYTQRHLGDEGSSTVRWQPPTGTTTRFSAASTIPAAQLAQINCIATTPQTCAPVFYPRLPRYDKYVHDQDRLGITGSMQWKPSSATLLTFDALYSKFDATRREQFLEAPSFSTAGAGGIGGTTITQAEVDSHNSLVYGVFNGVDIRTEARFDDLSTVFQQYTLDGTHDFTDRLHGHALIGWSESNHKNPIQTTVQFDDNNINGYSYDFRNNNRLPLITYGNVDVTNPAVWTISQIRLRPQTAKNTYKNGLADLTFDLTDVWSLKGGLQWKEYDFVTTEMRRSNGTLSNQETVIPANVAATPVSTYSTITQFGSNLSLPGGSVTRWLIPDVNAAASLFNFYDPSVFRMGTEPALGNNRTVNEKDTGGFVQADFKADLGGHTFRGGLGVRYVQTKQTASGFSFASGGPVLTTIEHTYTDTLPSLNLAYDLKDNLIARFGASKTMARPNLGSINPGASASVSGNQFTVTIGNAKLDPYRSTNYDLALEWYISQDSLLSGAIFYKDISSFVQTIRETGPFTGNKFGLPDSVAIAACGTTPGCNPAATWNFDIATNTPGGPLKGFEVNYQQAFTFLPGFWSNFGAILNYTGVESKVKYLNSAGVVATQDELTNLSKNAYNATLYFDNHKVSARVSAAYRSDYLTTVPGRNNNNVEGTASTLTVDFSASYEFDDHLEFTVEGLNLTDEFQDQWVDSDANRLSYYHHTGREYFVGARYKF